MSKGLYPFGLNHYRSLKFQKLRKLISKNQRNIKVEGAYGSSLSFLLIEIFSSINQQIFYISNSKETASYVYSDIIDLIGENSPGFIIPTCGTYNAPAIPANIADIVKINILNTVVL